MISCCLTGFLLVREKLEKVWEFDHSGKVRDNKKIHGKWENMINPDSAVEIKYQYY